VSPEQAALKAALLSQLSGRVGLVTHYNPDGDGLVACLSFQELLRLRGVNADIVLEKPCPDVYDYLDGRARTRVMSDDLAYNSLVLLDCHERERIGACAPLVDRASVVFAIDHHHERELIPGAHTYIDVDIVSVGGILWELFASEITAAPEPARTYMVEALYTTIINDTDNFLNANTDARTFSICAALAGLGLDAGRVAKLFTWSKTWAEMKLVGEVLAGMKLFADGRVLVMLSTVEMLDRLGLSGDATSKMTRWVKGMRGVQAVAYFQQTAPRSYRLSLRSEGVDVNRIARMYGGGGHTLASGCALEGDYPRLEAQIVALLEEQL